jgi:hypothetical protein
LGVLSPFLAGSAANTEQI